MKYYLLFCIFIFLSEQKIYTMDKSYHDLFLSSESESEEYIDPINNEEKFFPHEKKPNKQNILTKQKPSFWQRLLHSAASVFSVGKFTIIYKTKKTIKLPRPKTPDYVNKTIIFYPNK